MGKQKTGNRENKNSSNNQTASQKKGIKQVEESEKKQTESEERVNEPEDKWEGSEEQESESGKTRKESKVKGKESTEKGKSSGSASLDEAKTKTTARAQAETDYNNNMTKKGIIKVLGEKVVEEFTKVATLAESPAKYYTTASANLRANLLILACCLRSIYVNAKNVSSDLVKAGFTDKNFIDFVSARMMKMKAEFLKAINPLTLSYIIGSMQAVPGGEIKIDSVQCPVFPFFEGEYEFEISSKEGKILGLDLDDGDSERVTRSLVMKGFLKAIFTFAPKASSAEALGDILKGGLTSKKFNAAIPVSQFAFVLATVAMKNGKDDDDPYYSFGPIHEVFQRVEKRSRQYQPVNCTHLYLAGPGETKEQKDAKRARLDDLDDVFFRAKESKEEGEEEDDEGEAEDDEDNSERVDEGRGE